MSRVLGVTRLKVLFIGVLRTIMPAPGGTGPSADALDPMTPLREEGTLSLPIPY